MLERPDLRALNLLIPWAQMALEIFAYFDPLCHAYLGGGKQAYVTTPTTYFVYRLLQLCHYYSVPEVKLKYSESGGSHPFIYWMNIECYTVDVLQ